MASSSLFSQLEVVWQKTYPEYIQFAKFSPDGKYLYCAIGDSIVILDALSGERLRRFEGTQSCYHMSISNSGNYLITGIAGGIAIWDIKAEKYLKQYGGGIVYLAISNDDKYMYWLYSDGYMRIVDMKNDSIVKQIQTHKIQSAKLSNNGKILAIGYSYKGFNQMGETVFYVKLELWDAENLTFIKVLQDAKGSDGYWNFDFSKEDKYFASISSVGFVNTIYNILENNIEEVSPNNLPVFNFKFTKDNSKLYYRSGSVLDYKTKDNNLFSYNMKDKIMETEGDTNQFYIFMGSFKWFTLLKKSITSVNYESEIPYLIINYSQDGILQLKCSYDVEQPFEITISTIEGKIIYTSNEAELNSTKEMIFKLQLSNGTYITKAKTKNRIYTQKFQVLR
jgi:WD40 repeat protein